jgi:hypothetical protein
MKCKLGQVSKKIMVKFTSQFEELTIIYQIVFQESEFVTGGDVEHGS